MLPGIEGGWAVGRTRSHLVLVYEFILMNSEKGIRIPTSKLSGVCACVRLWVGWFGDLCVRVSRVSLDAHGTIHRRTSHMTIELPRHSKHSVP